MSRKKTKKATKRTTKAKATKRKSNMSDSARKTGKAAKAKPRRAARSSKTDNSTAAAKPMSALDAAAIVLKDVGRPLNCRELIEMMAARELWQSPNGKTPEATLYAAILRTIGAKGDAAPFKKVGRGLFSYNGR